MTFDALMAAMDPAMVVVTAAVGDAAGDGEHDGCLVGFHSQCSIDPPRYAVWLSRANRTFELAGGATHLAVHLLGEGDRDLAELFGGETGDEVDKLATVAWEPGPGGAPLLARVARRFAGRIVARVEMDADHVCVILDPVDVTDRDDVGAPWGGSLRLAAVADLDPGHGAGERR